MLLASQQSYQPCASGLNRRSLLGGVGTLTLAGCATFAASHQQKSVGLADITVMADLTLDYPGTLQRVKALGYDAFSFRLRGYGGLGGGEPAPADKAAMVRDAGLRFDLVRLGVRNVDYERDLDDAAAIGARYVAMTTAPPFIAGPKLFETTRRQFEDWLPKLGDLAEKAHARGLTMVYHNHWYDLHPLEGDLPLDLIARAVEPRLLAFEVDLAWTWYAGVSPLALLARLGPRVVSMHLKDIDRTRGSNTTDYAVAPGLGEMDYPALLPEIARLTSAQGYVEVDTPDNGLAAAEAGLRTVRASWEKAA